MIADEEHMEAQPMFQQLSSDLSDETVSSVNREHITPFLVYKGGEGIFINPRTILRIRIEITEVPWTELRIEEKSQSNTPFTYWVRRLLSNSDFKKR